MTNKFKSMIKSIVIAFLLSLGANQVFGQSSATRNFDVFAVTIGPVQDEGTQFRIVWPSGQTINLLVPNVSQPGALARELWHYAGRRIVIRADREIVIIDPSSGTVVDRFLALRHSRSPDGRYIAIQRFLPNGVEFVDAVVSIYDLQKTPGQNRPQSAMAINAGRIVYPQQNVSAQRYSIAVDAGEEYGLLSPLVWVAQNVLAFVAHHQGALSVVVVDAENTVGPMTHSETDLPIHSLLKPTASASTVAALLTVRSIELISESPSSLSLRIALDPAYFLQTTTLTAEATRPE